MLPQPVVDLNSCPPPGTATTNLAGETIQPRPMYGIFVAMTVEELDVRVERGSDAM